MIFINRNQNKKKRILVNCKIKLRNFRSKLKKKEKIIKANSKILNKKI